MTLEILTCKDDFEWYCKELDVRHKYRHEHNGKPDRYPCKIESQWHDDPNGPYYYEHEFYYQKEEVCPCCKHKIMVWDIGDEE
jgi:hypothetical protein